ncbi:uncharacterized protein [Periplaneta americana]|uniref:uncharacterized protein n=1 Tax=Periplaneta americana TaxID=6978 RepID=UPI0037E9170D
MSNVHRAPWRIDIARPLSLPGITPPPINAAHNYASHLFHAPRCWENIGCSSQMSKRRKRVELGEITNMAAITTTADGGCISVAEITSSPLSTSIVYLDDDANRNHYRRPSTLAFGSSRLGVPTLEKKSSSDPELGSRATIIGNEAGLPPGLTVDELRLYRRRRPPSHLRPKDNLRTEEGSLKSITSEYRRRYIPPALLPTDKEQNFGEDHLVELLGASEGSLVTAVNTDRDGDHHILVKKGRRRRRPEDGLRLEGEVILRPEYHDTFVDFPRQRPKVIRPRTHITSESQRQMPMDMLTEKNAQYVFFDSARKAELARRPTTLRNEGELLVKESEIRSRYVPHEGAKKADLARRKTSLRMEGDIETVTEQKEKYVGFTEGRRAELSKRPTQLTLEGEMDTLTEKNEKYVYFPSPKRSGLKKRPTNLKLEGEMEKVTENADNFIEFLEGKRAEMLRRSNNLSLEGDVQYAPEYRDTFVDFPRERPVLRRPPASLKQEGEFDTTTEKNSQFVDFLSRSKRPDLARKPTNLSLEGEIELKPQYRETYIDFPRQRPKIKKPDASLKPEGEFEKVTEKEAQYVPFSSAERSVIVRRPPVSLRLEGEMSANPEYKESFVNFPRERPVTRKPAGQLQHDPNTSLLLTDEGFRRPRGPGRPPDCNLRSEGRIEADPEYRSSFLDMPRERPITRRPQGQLRRPNGDSNTHTPRAQSERRHRRLTEVEAESRRTYVDFTARDRTPSRRRRPEDNLKGAGGTSLVAAISSPRVSRRLNVTTRIVPTVTHSSGAYTAEPRTRAKTVTFELGDSRPRTCPRWSDSKGAGRQDTSNESEDSLLTDGCSDEPTFRLHVMNVDETSEENDDFARRRRRGRRRRASRSSPPHPILSTSIVSSRAPSPEGAPQFVVQQPVQYPLHQMEQNNNPAFVVLDDLNNNNHYSQATTAIPRSNFLDIPPKQQSRRGGGGGHVNWMPPWHDAPTSI